MTSSDTETAEQRHRRILEQMRPLPKPKPKPRETTCTHTDYRQTQPHEHCRLMSCTVKMRCVWPGCCVSAREGREG